MSLREKVKQAFHRSHSTPRPTTNRHGVKLEYYKRHEIPRSKFKGPFDREHQKRLAAWNFETAQEDRPRSPDLSLSPCATLPYPEPVRSQPLDDSDASLNMEQSDELSDLFDNSPMVIHDEYATAGSQSSTAVNSNTSVVVLSLDDYPTNSIARLKRSMHNTSLATKKSPKSKLLKGMPFAPEDLSRALHAVQI